MKSLFSVSILFLGLYDAERALEESPAGVQILLVVDLCGYCRSELGVYQYILVTDAKPKCLRGTG